MKQSIKSFLTLAAVFSFASAQASTSFFSIRPQSANVAREMVGVADMINLCDMDHTYGMFSVTPEYTQSFRQDRIAQCIFGTDVGSTSDCATLTISGCAIPNGPGSRGANDWLADYFGLPRDFKSTITFRPRIRNFNLDLGFYLGLDELAQGLYFRVGGPVTHTRWDLRFCESAITTGTTGYPAGYYDNTGITSATAVSTSLLSNATEFFSGAKAPTLASGYTFQKLKCSKWNVCNGKSDELTKTRFADLNLELGYNFVCNDDYRLGLGLRASAPTGNKADGEFLFEAIAGRNGSWTLGGTLSAQGIFWRNEQEDKHFGLYVDAHVQHWFKGSQTRCFDLCGKPNSRYMLAHKVTGTGLFNNELAPIANLTQSKVDVSVGVEGDIAAMFRYVSGNFGCDLGYNFYGRGCEKITRDCSCLATDPLDGESWAIKGDAHVIGWVINTTSKQELHVSDSKATIHGGSNNCAATNAGVDAAVVSGLSQLPSVAGPPSQPLNQSSTPVFLKVADVDFGGTKIITHKVFTHLSYAWNDKEDWVPFLGIGAEAEFDSKSDCSKTDDCSTTKSCTTTTSTDCCDTKGSCSKCGLSQWGVWIKGGVSFD